MLTWMCHAAKVLSAYDRVRARQLWFLLIVLLQNFPNGPEQFLVALCRIRCCEVGQFHALKSRTPN